MLYTKRYYDYLPYANYLEPVASYPFWLAVAAAIVTRTIHVVVLMIEMRL